LVRVSPLGQGRALGRAALPGVATILLISGTMKLVPRMSLTHDATVLGAIEVALGIALLPLRLRYRARRVAAAYVLAATAFTIWHIAQRRESCTCFGGWVVLDPWLRLSVLGAALFLLGAGAPPRSHTQCADRHASLRTSPLH
jgi:hypothetical protein